MFLRKKLFIAASMYKVVKGTDVFYRYSTLLYLTKMVCFGICIDMGGIKEKWPTVRPFAIFLSTFLLV